MKNVIFKSTGIEFNGVMFHLADVLVECNKLNKGNCLSVDELVLEQIVDKIRNAETTLEAISILRKYIDVLSIYIKTND